MKVTCDLCSKIVKRREVSVKVIEEGTTSLLRFAYYHRRCYNKVYA